MLKDTQRCTRKTAIIEERILDLTDEAEGYGIRTPVAITQAALQALDEKDEGCTGAATIDVLAMLKLHASGKLLPFASRRTEAGREFQFKVFVNICQEPEEVVLKAVTGPGDFGEEVLTIMLPDEQVAFTGGLTRIRAEYLLHLSRFTDKSDAQGALSCVRVEPHPAAGALLVALNGHAMGVFHDAEAYCQEPFQMALTQNLIRECKAKYNDIGGRFVIIGDGRVTVEGNTGHIHYIEPERLDRDVEYPNWRPILDRAAAEAGQRTPASQVLLPADQMGMFDLRGKGREERGMRLFCGDPMGPVTVRVAAYPEFLGIIMPLKDTASTQVPEAMPAWLKPAAEPEPIALDGFMDRIEAALAA
jgi:hypothetical protein